MNTTISGDGMAVDVNTPLYAGLGKRVAAFALDYLLITGYLIILSGISVGVTMTLTYRGVSLPIAASPFVLDVVAFLTAVLPVILYFAVQESSQRQATWGKRKVGLKVVNRHGERLSKRQAFVRAVVKFLPWQIAHTSLFQIPGWPFAPESPTPMVVVGLTLAQVMAVVYVLALGIGKTHCTPYDRVAGSFVIEMGSERAA